STLDQRIEVEADGVYFVDSTGVRLIYPNPPSSGEILPMEGPRWPLARTEDGYRVTRRDGRTLYFRGEGGLVPLSAIVDRAGHRIDFGYDATGAPIEVRHSGGYRVGVDVEARRIHRIWLHNEAGDPITLM